jgi:hypothetical protein
VLNIEQILRDVYKLYQNSSKRKQGLEEITLVRQQPLIDFLNNMTGQIKDGKAELRKDLPLGYNVGTQRDGQVVRNV